VRTALTMKLLFTCCLFFMLFSGCKKSAENKLEDLILTAMVEGQWEIVEFKVNSTDVTADFNGYKFQYHSNKTVDAILNGQIDQSGTWDGNALQKTTSANFPSPVYPIDLLNGTWKITNNTWTYVKATQTVNGDTRYFHLKKI